MRVQILIVFDSKISVEPSRTIFVNLCGIKLSLELDEIATELALFKPISELLALFGIEKW
jgi:hypothetical protein